MSTIKDKELLTFSNLTNLEWQFLKFESDNLDNQNSEESDETSNTIEGKKLNELLTPDIFVRKNNKNEFENYVYLDESVEEDQITPEERQKGLEEMRANAPVAMNYLEECGKNSGEGDFLQEWEAWVS